MLKTSLRFFSKMTFWITILLMITMQKFYPAIIMMESQMVVPPKLQVKA
jgi:hypothetical protein